MVEDDPATLEAYRELTPQQRKAVKKPALQNILDSIATDNGAEPDATVVNKLDQILNELKEIKEKKYRLRQRSETSPNCCEQSE